MQMTAEDESKVEAAWAHRYSELEKRYNQLDRNYWTLWDHFEKMNAWRETLRVQRDEFSRERDELAVQLWKANLAVQKNPTAGA